MGIDRLNSAVWAAGFAMAPTEDDTLEAVVPSSRDVSERAESGSWQSATVEVPARLPDGKASATGGLRQWIAGLQRRATA